MVKKLRRKIVSTMIILSFIITITYLPAVNSQTEYYLTLETDPPDVEIIDPEALTGEGTYPSGCIIIDAKQTIISEGVRYEFAGWSTTDNCNPDPEEDPPELVGNQVTIMMDANRYVVAKYYEVPNTYTLTLETDPNVLYFDPNALHGAGVYDAGDTATISAEPYVYASDTARYEFYRWTSDDIPNPTGNPADVVMDGDYTITAEYRLYYYLDAVTDPPEVQAADPYAVSGQGWYRSGTYGIVDAKQTVVSGMYSYEFTSWETEDPYYDEEEEEYVALPPNQAARFMDGSWTMVAQYETTVTKWGIKLIGEFDYLEYEDIKIRLAALVTYSDTGSPVSNADVIIEIYNENGKRLVTNVMVEKLAGTGIYEWKSPQTIRNLMLNKKIDKGIYLVHVQALIGEEPVASDVMMFHIDPPGEDPVSMTALIIAVMAVLASVMTPLILVKQGLIGFTKKSSS